MISKFVVLPFYINRVANNVNCGVALCQLFYSNTSVQHIGNCSVCTIIDEVVFIGIHIPFDKIRCSLPRNMSSLQLQN